MNKSGDRHEMKSHQDIFVDLAILKGKVETSEYTDHEYFMRQALLEKESIDIKDIVGVNDDYTLISGIAGVGKSYLVNEIMYQWANRDLFNGDNGMPDIQLLLPIRCREINVLNLSSDDGIEGIFKRIFPDIFCKNFDVDTLKDLREKILVVVDGVDELVTVDEINQSEERNNSANRRKLEFIRELIVTRNEIKLPHRYTITVGRPRVTEMIRHSIARNICAREVQVCGFNADCVQKYIEKHCHSEEIKLKVRQEIKMNASIQALSCVPVYLWVICNIYKSDVSILTPKTVTELMIYACLAFFRDHLIKSEVKSNDVTLMNLCEDPMVQTLVISISKLCFLSLKERRIIFQAEEIRDIVDDVDGLEKGTGLIIKHENDSESTYEFSHLVLHEFFAAFHIMLSNDLQPSLCCQTLTDPQFSDRSYRHGVVYVNASSNSTHETDIHCNNCAPLYMAFNGPSYGEYIAKLEKERFMNYINSSGIVLVHSSPRGYIAYLENCYPVIAGLEALLSSKSSNTLLRRFITSIATKFNRDEVKQRALISYCFHSIFIDYHVSKTCVNYDENSGFSMLGYTSRYLNGFIHCCVEADEIPSPELFLEKPPIFQIDEQFMLRLQYEFVKMFRKRKSRFHLQCIAISSHFINDLSDTQLDLLAYLVHSSKEFRMFPNFPNRFYQKILALPLEDSALQIIHLLLNEVELTPCLLKVLSSVSHLDIFVDINDPNYLRNVKVLSEFFQNQTVQLKKLSLHCQDKQPNKTMRIIKTIAPLFQFVETLDLYPVVYPVLCPIFEEYSSNGKLAVQSLSVKSNSQNAKDDFRAIRFIQVLPEVKIYLDRLLPNYFEVCDVFFSRWMEESNGEYGKCVFNAKSKMCNFNLQEFNTKFNPTFSIEVDHFTSTTLRMTSCSSIEPTIFPNN